MQLGRDRVAAQNRARNQRIAELESDVRALMNIIALMPYALDRLPEGSAEPTVRIPMQRSRTAAEAEDRLFHQLPHYRRRPTDLWPIPPRDVPSARPRPGGPA